MNVLADTAPYVITSISTVTDEECIAFIQGFYEYLFREKAIERAFDQAMRLLTIKGIAGNHFRLSRRSLLKKGNSLYAESIPGLYKDSILVNLDLVKDQIAQLGISEEEFCFLLAKKLRVHYWIFERARDSAIIPIGRQLFGEFHWHNAKDIVYCKKLMKLDSNVPQIHWEMWAKVLTIYNDLASCEYRTVDRPGTPASKWMLERAVQLFSRYVEHCLVPLRTMLHKLTFPGVSAHIEFAVAETERAARELEWERYPQVVEALELALTNYHEILNALQPPEEKHESH